MNFALTPFKLQTIQTIPWKEFFILYREPVVTYCITPNNAPTTSNSRYSNKRRNYYQDDFDDDVIVPTDLLFNVLSGLFSKFYLPERVRFNNGIKIKLNDVVSYKIVFDKGLMKFYLTVPQKWEKSFLGAVKKDWGSVDITFVEKDFITFDHKKALAMNIHLKHHHSLAIRNERNFDPLYPALSSIAATLSTKDKMIIDYNISPLSDLWKGEAERQLHKFNKGIIPRRKEKSIYGLIGMAFDFVNIIMDEALQLVYDLMNIESEKVTNGNTPKWDLEYSQKKIHANSKGFKVQIRAIAESDDKRKTKMMLKNAQSAFTSLDGDNQFTSNLIKTERGVKRIIKAVDENKPTLIDGEDIFFEKEMNQLVRIPSKQTLKEYKRVIDQDNYTRTEIDPDFFDPNNDSIPFATTLDKEPKVLHLGGYKREWWTAKGRYVKDKTKLDDRSMTTMLGGSQGSGKTSLIIRQACHTFGIHLNKDEWKEHSKSVVLFDVADGEIVTKVWNTVPEWLRHRIIILNHSNFQNPIPVNFSELEEFNRVVMQDEDYAFKLAEMESHLVRDVLQAERSVYVDRWFTTALQCAHIANKDWGYAEAIRLLTDDEFRINEVIPFVDDERMQLELEIYNEMRTNGKSNQIVQTIQNRFVQLERDQKLWDCIGQKPLRNSDETCAVDFRKWMDGDQDGAYLVLVYIPKDNVSEMYRKFLFAHYFMKIWNVGLSRASGFAGREYRPETLVVFDEVHQIIDVPTVAEMFIDLFKESRKYSLRFLLSIHGWSSLAKAGRTFESKIKQSILDNGCNLVMLKGGKDIFESLENFMGGMSVEDYENLMNMEFCGIFAIRWQNKNHVFQARLLPPVDADENKTPAYLRYLLFEQHDNWDLNDLTKYKSPYGRAKRNVREDNLVRVRKMLKKSILENEDIKLMEGVSWEELEEAGTKD